MGVPNVGGMTSSEVLLQDLIDLEAKEVIAGLVEAAVSMAAAEGITTRLSSVSRNCRADWNRSSRFFSRQ